jgi:hypothetical protein
MVSICTPTSAPTTTMALSATRRAAMTSPTKSADPGVSRKLILEPCQLAWVREAWIDSLRAISSSVKSLVVRPVSTRSAFAMAPVAASSCSTSDVLPVPPWPTMATLRIEAVGTLMD